MILNRIITLTILAYLLSSIWMSFLGVSIFIEIMPFFDVDAIGLASELAVISSTIFYIIPVSFLKLYDKTVIGKLVYFAFVVVIGLPALLTLLVIHCLLVINDKKHFEGLS